MDKKDAAICAAVWRAWAHNWFVSFHTVGLPSTTVSQRVHGINSNGSRMPGGGLLDRGWLRMSANRDGTLRPGRRFAGLDSDGTPLVAHRY